MAQDPVCRKEIDPLLAAGESTYGGQTYYFCCAACKARFDANPERYTGPAVGPH